LWPETRSIQLDLRVILGSLFVSTFYRHCPFSRTHSGIIGQSTASEGDDMRQHRWAILSFMAVLVILAKVPVNADVLNKTMNIGGTTVHYKVVLQKNYDANKAY